MPAMLPLIFAAMAVSAQAVPMPDVINITLAPIHWCQQLLHGEWPQAPQWLVDPPQVLLPTVDEIKELSYDETRQRAHFFVSALVILFVVTVVLGTATMVLGPRVIRRRLHAHGSPRIAMRTEYETLASHGGESSSVSFQRHLVSLAFACTAAASTAACLFSIQTDRLNKSVGLDWEIYLLLFSLGCLSFLVQSVFAVRWLPMGEKFAWIAFAEAAVHGLAPFISDYFDTLKDTIFAGLCFQSKHLELRIMGVLSWFYLLVIHIYFLNNDNTLAELASCYLPVLLALSEPAAAPGADVEDCFTKLRSAALNFFEKLRPAVLFLMYKQCTPTKRQLLLIENIPQGFLSAIFLCVEGGSRFVLVVNLVIPTAQVLATFVLFKPLLACVAPQLGKKLVGFLQKPDYLKAKQMWLEAWQDDLLRAALPQLLEVAFINDLARELNLEGTEQNEKLLTLFRDLLEEAIENEGIVDLEKARDGVEALDCIGILDAAEHGRLGAVRHFVRNKPEALGKTAADGSTAVHMASAQGHVQVLEFLKAANASLEAKSNDGSTAVHMASAQGHVQVLEFLTAANATFLEAKSNDGFTPLHLASAHGHEDAVNWLVAQGAQLDAETKDGKTPSDLATENGQSEIVKILQEAADEKAAAKYSDSADDPAILGAAEAGDLPAVRGLIRADPGAVRRTDKYGATALHWAAERDAVAALAAARAELEATRHSDRRTPLHWAVVMGRAAAVAKLLELRAAVRPKDFIGNTPLHLAVREGNEEVTRLLLAAKAPLDLRNDHGKTALDWARSKGHSEVVRLLEDAARR